jgi:hypothetical protein
MGNLPWDWMGNHYLSGFRLAEVVVDIEHDSGHNNPGPV